MKTAHKIIIFPLIILLTIIRIFCEITMNTVAPISIIISVILSITGVFCCINDGIRSGVIVLILAIIVSCIPVIARMIIEKIQLIKIRIRMTEYIK